jgi:hypothetical protein
VVIRATDREVDLSGSPSEMRGIAYRLAALSAGQSCEFVADAAADSAPYDRVLSGFRAAASGGRVRISVAGSWLVAEGDPVRLAKLGSWFGFPDESKFPAHGHYEWFPDHPDIADDSLPLVIGVAKDGPTKRCT